MPNRKQEIAECRVRGREREPGERFSARGKCALCGATRLGDNIRQMHEHNGEAFDNWRRKVAASVGAVLLDDL